MWTVSACVWMADAHSLPTDNKKRVPDNAQRSCRNTLVREPEGGIR